MPAPAPSPSDPLMPGITARQAESLRFFFQYFQRHRCYPFLHEVAKAVGFQRGSAAACLKPLLNKGLLQRNGATSRNYELTELGLAKLARMGVKPIANPDPGPLNLPVAPRRLAQAMSIHVDEPEREVYFLVEFNSTIVTRCAGGFDDPSGVLDALTRWQANGKLRRKFHYRMLKLCALPGAASAVLAEHFQDGPETHSFARSTKGHPP